MGDLYERIQEVSNVVWKSTVNPEIPGSPSPSRIQGKNPGSLSSAQGERVLGGTKETLLLLVKGTPAQPPENRVTRPGPQAGLLVGLLTQTKHLSPTVWLGNKGSKNTRSW